MITLEEIREMLQDRRIPLIVEATGLSYQTITGIRDGLTVNPEYQTLVKLSQYFQAREGGQ